MTATASGGRAGARTGLVVLAVLGALLLVGALTIDRRTDEAFDPRSTAPTGTRALVELLESFGAEVDIAEEFPGPGDADVAIAFEDVIPPSAGDSVRDWVERGGTLVMADPVSDLVPELIADPDPTFDSTIDRGTCDIPALDGVDELMLGTQLGDRLRYVDDGTLPVCFSDGVQAFVVVTPMGDGHVVGLASPVPLANDQLGDADNAALATALLAPRPGTRVAVLTDAAFPGEQAISSITDSLDNLIGPGVGFFLLQILVGGGLFALARGRRLGRPLVEPQPVQIAGSELVGATGNLLQQRRDPDRAAAVLRAELRRVLAERLGLPPDQPPAALAEALANRTGLSREEAYALVHDGEVTDNAALVQLAHRIDLVREEVLHGHAP